MKSVFVFSLVLISLFGCAKVDRTSNNGDFYISQSMFRGSEFDCYGCLVMETQDYRTFKITWTSDQTTEEGDPIDGCATKGSSFYEALGALNMPDASSPTQTWNLDHQGNNHDALCFPENLVINIEFLSTNEYRLDYNSKVYRVRKGN